MKRRLIAILLLITLFIQLLSGCGRSSSSGISDFSDLVANLHGGGISDDGDGSGSVSGEITREELILDVSRVIGLKEISDEDFSFDDFSDADSPGMIEAAIRQGMVSIEPDEDNMEYFHPKEAATREFAAYVLTHALDYQMDEDESYDWTDLSETAYPKEAEKSIELGVFELTDNYFYPDQGLSAKEEDALLDKVEEVMDSTNITETHSNIELAEGVESSTLSYNLDEENKLITLDDTSGAAGWAAGEVHVLHSEDDSRDDIAIKITEITSNEDGTVEIQYETPELDEVVDSIDAEGSVSEGFTFTPAEGGYSNECQRIC